MHEIPVGEPLRRTRLRQLLVACVLFALSALVLPGRPALAAPAPGSTAFVRVNQVGYPATGSKRAYLMSSAAEAGATFQVRDANGTPVLAAPIGPNRGSWSTAYP